MNASLRELVERIKNLANDNRDDCKQRYYREFLTSLYEASREFRDLLVISEGRDTQRDKALLAFQVACKRPTAADIVEWTKRYPQFAADIREHAAIARDWAAADEVEQLKAELATEREQKNFRHAAYLDGLREIEKLKTENETAKAEHDAYLNSREIDRLQGGKIILRNRLEAQHE